MGKLDVATVKALFPKVDGLPTECGWYFFRGRDSGMWAKYVYFGGTRHFDTASGWKVERGVNYRYDAAYENYAKNLAAFGPIPLNQIAEILKDTNS